MRFVFSACSFLLSLAVFSFPKADNLVRLREAKFPVPEFEVIHAKHVREAIEQQLAKKNTLAIAAWLEAQG